MRLVALALLAGLTLLAASVWFFMAICVPEDGALPLMIGGTLQIVGSVALVAFLHAFRAEVPAIQYFARDPLRTNYPAAEENPHGD